jgi:glycosyltransferase involved in cell wall biosynthesis
MRIALTADPELPVPPRLYGGIERIIDLLARGLEARGHTVTLFAHPASQSARDLVAWPGRSSRSASDTARNAALLTREVARRRFDLVHSFSRIAYLTPILPLPIPKLMTYQREISARSVKLGHILSRGTLHFSAISHQMTQPVERTGAWHWVYNGVDLDTYPFVAEPPQDAPLVFLGRIEPIKGPHLAVEIAARTGSRLVIAGNVPDPYRAWFEAEVQPHVDGERIRYIGPVDDAEKGQLLGAARALLMPIQWEEPFGIVMAEAMACGTPVLGLAHGAVPEVVADGVTGFVRGSVDELVEAAGRIGELNRLACRQRVEALFSDRTVVDGYLAVYGEMLRTRSRQGRAGERRPQATH